MFITTLSISYSQNKTCIGSTTYVATISRAQSSAGQARHQSFLNGTASFSSGGVASPASSTYSGASASYGGYSNYSYRPATPRIHSTRVPISRNKIRTFTNKNGSKVEARLISINATNKTARIRDKKGLSYNVSISKFCSSDVSYLKSWWTSRNPSNKLTGYKAFLAKKRNG